MHSYTTVFDLANSGLRDWTFPAFGLIFVAVGLGIFFFPDMIKATGIPYADFQSKRMTFFRYSFLGFALFWTASAFLSTYPSYRHDLNLVKNNACKTVAGPVENFVPMPYSGHAEESFTKG